MTRSRLCRKTLSGVDRLHRRLDFVGLHRRYSGVSPASASLPANDSLDLWPTTGFPDRAWGGANLDQAVGGIDGAEVSRPAMGCK